MKSKFDKSMSEESITTKGSSSGKPSNVVRQLNINVGDQKNTVLIQGCANRCPDVYDATLLAEQISIIMAI